MKTELTYKTFNELLDEVSLDFRTYADEGMIEASQLIKIAQKINYDLGLRIHKTKSDIIEISHGKAKLPDDFYVLNHALLCSHYKYAVPTIQGRQSEDVKIDLSNYCGHDCTTCYKPNPCKPSNCSHETQTPDLDLSDCCKCPKIFTNECGDHFTVIHKIGYELRTYDEFEYLTFKPGKHVDQHCCNLHMRSKHTAEIKNGFIYTSMSHGKLYISYEGAMEDEEGNLLVLDHPMINEYYEAAFKVRILENLYMNGEEVQQKLIYMKNELKIARNNSLGIVNTPDFAELQQIHDMNRKAMYHKYYRMFQR